MNEERFRQTEELYHSAREREPGERSVFLAEACRGDEDLRRQASGLSGVGRQRPEATGEQKGSAHVTVLLNFFDELRRRVPVGK